MRCPWVERLNQFLDVSHLQHVDDAEPVDLRWSAAVAFGVDAAILPVPDCSSCHRRRSITTYVGKHAKQIAGIAGMVIRYDKR